ncbi:site-specific integrase [Methylocystis sp. WRRC1]|uniref:tyrosine-type recombinase/integrase n=1 Tax=Methylocystis sp. WRRC1 TaxID=1732014 RepID=UPI001D145DC4|nr:site-specific integrase [Methylocystis sp. WRRC1]MCC3246412.1 site-specific integrase [Methylocystis sp. WRRC1]
MPALTEITIRNLKPPEKGQVAYMDDALRGFGVRVSAGGTKSFILVHGLERRRVTIGRYPIISLAEARAEAKRILAEKTLGHTFERSVPFEDALAQFLDHSAQTKRPLTTRDYKRLLTSHFPFGRTQLGDVTPREILRRLDRLRATPAEQSHALVALKVFMSWCVKRHLISRSPCEAMSAAKQRVRERVLSDDELKKVFAAALEGQDAFSRIVAILTLTGQRRGEVAALRWEYLNDGERTITLPSSLTKNKRPHTFPYGALAASILENTPRIGDFVFPASREHVRGKPTVFFNGWGKCKESLDRTCGVSDWTLHDLRRTFATNMAALGVRIEVTEKLLNHVSGSFGGIVGVYQRHNYLDEMRQAIDAWEARLTALLSRA